MKQDALTLKQGDLLLDIEDCLNWMTGGYSDVTHGRILRIRELLDELEGTINNDDS